MGVDCDGADVGSLQCAWSRVVNLPISESMNALNHLPMHSRIGTLRAIFVG